MKYLAAALLGASALIAVVALASPAQPDKPVWAAAQAARTEQLKLLETLVNIDSGTGDAAGGRKVEAVLIPLL
ncbi:MAG: hypothetical protein HY243_03885, partial [Proteobacteria bacterium]|nr:hypothetical protein [Pseudomonadota bacterium]